MTKVILTDKLRAQILDLIEQGYSVRYIYDKVGIGGTVYYRWQDEDQEFQELCQRARRIALMDMKTTAEDCIKRKMEKEESDSWRAGAWFLSHKHPAEYAERRIQDNSDKTACPFDRLMDAIHKRDSKPETEKK